MRMLSGRMERKWFVLITVGLGTFMSALDGSVVNTILPVIQRKLGGDINAIEWVVTIYLLTVSGLLLGFGRLGDMRGHRGVYLVGFGIFVVGSALCGLAPTRALLVCARAAQAIGAAMLFSNSPAILTRSFPARERGRALGLQATMTYLGLTAGPLLGGWLTDAFGWRSVFFINVPVGLLGIALAWVFAPREEGEHARERFDIAGGITFLLGLVGLLLALDRGHEWGWRSIRIAVLFAVALALLLVFVVLELRVENPMLELRLFRSRTLSGATLGALFNYITLYTVTFVVPFVLFNRLHLSPSRTGLLMTAQSLVMAVVAPLSGTQSDRIGTRIPAVAGMSILAVAMLLLAGVVVHPTQAEIAGVLALAGLGTGTFISPNNSALLGAAPRDRQGIASGVLAEARNVGMSLGVGISGAVLGTLSGPTGGSIEHAARVSFLLAAGFAACSAIVSALR